ncbi:hypothetical protein GQX73_g9524 [Xylaria multiplex]|uniref:Uncharacterized protein n=1 Tax=Xylaria multiplex TaxID=323545 RepID=A0A7C8MJD8_9PEZI|nr:hypothetical protein GQX73_g9524 [Xylaria multiplex]
MASPADLLFTIGNDICRIARVRRILKGRLGPQFVRRILRPEEIQSSPTADILRCVLNQNAQSSQATHAVPRRVEAVDSVPTRDAPDFTRAVEFMAGRFAAKEAVIKAHPHRRLTFQTIAILRAALPTHSARDSVFSKHERVDESSIDKPAAQKLESEDKPPAPQSGPLVAWIEGEENAHRQMYASVSISHDTEHEVPSSIHNIVLVPSGHPFKASNPHSPNTL